MDDASRCGPAGRAADIPSVDRLLQDPLLRPVMARYGRTEVVAILRTYLDQLRARVLTDGVPHEALTAASIVPALEERLRTRSVSKLKPVFNLTGTVLHTNLGRAPLPEEALQALLASASVPVTLEYDLSAGGRGERDLIVEELLCELCGAPAATVVNNNAAAVLLTVSALAARREVLVSRGELIEIGGAFRIPDVMRQAGARLVEVGTTNRTRVSDYEEGITERSALLMKVHTSNYVIQGFTASVTIAELAQVAQRAALPLVTDLGSGSLVDLTQWGLPREPTVRETLAAGADLVCFSGDKLLGGPQAGLIVGRADFIAKLRKHPLKRALRVGKLTLAALEAVLGLYRTPERLAERLITLRLLTRPAEAIRAQAARLREAVQNSLGGDYEVSPAATSSQIGSGALPIERLPSYALAVRRASHGGGSLKTLERSLRQLPRPVLGRLAEQTLWLDLRCLEPDEEAEFVAQLGQLSR
jgi:L-seryl-tRNA(Ser) seleniumtransferase